MIGRELNKTEIKVLNLITNRATFEEPTYRRQILTEQKNLSIVMAVDLEKYWKLEHD